MMMVMVMVVVMMMMMMMMMMMHRLSSLRFRANPRNLPYISIYIYIVYDLCTPYRWCVRSYEILNPRQMMYFEWSSMVYEVWSFHHGYDFLGGSTIPILLHHVLNGLIYSCIMLYPRFFWLKSC